MMKFLLDRRVSTPTTSLVSYTTHVRRKDHPDGAILYSLATEPARREWCHGDPKPRAPHALLWAATSFVVATDVTRMATRDYRMVDPSKEIARSWTP